MPWHVHPHLRAIEEAREAVGLILTLDSQGVVVIKNDEAAGTRTKVLPAFTVVAHGTTYKPK